MADDDVRSDIGADFWARSPFDIVIPRDIVLKVALFGLGLGAPRSGTFSTTGGALLVFFACSGFSATPNANLHHVVRIDGSAYVQAILHTNEANSHKALVPGWVLIEQGTILAGDHTWDEQVTGGTTDFNDYMSLFIAEIPPSDTVEV